MGVSLEQRTDSMVSILMDTVSPTLCYIGEAPCGSPPSASVWRIKRLDTSSGIELKYADGNICFDNVWNDRSALSYF